MVVLYLCFPKRDGYTTLVYLTTAKGLTMSNATEKLRKELTNLANANGVKEARKATANAHKEGKKQQKPFHNG